MIQGKIWGVGQAKPAQHPIFIASPRQFPESCQTSPVFATGEVYNFRNLFPEEFFHADRRLHRPWPDG
jgi:hypothetical protein